MELKATSIGKKLAQHPYHRVRMLTAGVEVTGDHHEYIIPFNQLLGVRCKRGVVWGELEFQLAEDKVVRLHGTEWSETQRFWQHLMKSWQSWTEQMVVISDQVLSDLQHFILDLVQKDGWLTQDALSDLQIHIEEAFSALPLPKERLREFPESYQRWQFCHLWLTAPEAQRQQRNHQWMAQLEKGYADFFATVERSPLNLSQRQAVMNDEKSVLVLAGAGCGKTAVLVAKTAWLLTRKQAQANQIVVLAFGHKAAEELSQRIALRVGTTDVTAKTFHSLALMIIQQATHKSPKITELESDKVKRYKLLLEQWIAQCSQKKAAANQWRQCLEDDVGWSLTQPQFWESPDIQEKIPLLLDKWLGLIRMHGGTQAQMIEQADEVERPLFTKRIKLITPIVKAWKLALKEEGAIDFAGLLEQACGLVEKGRFISPWKYLLIDEFQDISPQRAKLVALLRQQNKHSRLYAVGDDWQAIYRFTGAQLDLTTKFAHYFGQVSLCQLDTSYRLDQRLNDVASGFVQQNAEQIQKTLVSPRQGNKKSITLLHENQLDALLDKLSGFVTRDETILVLGRYHYLKPKIFAKATTRWPNLSLAFMTMHASKGQEADYVIICGLNAGQEGFPAEDRETVIERGLLIEQESYPYAEERRLAYVAMTRAKQRTWLLFNPQNPSLFVAELKQLGVPIAKKA
ncbi:DNA helicase IV [Rosenbergiella australiborealis]|uniref:DNA helicase IV n=1 Tax=Rosenbergiella australiborealis TaxID=1544696 RepID=UPI001F4DD436|nr:DNA helicase IV [Rosenbergiella australiborealis]